MPNGTTYNRHGKKIKVYIPSKETDELNPEYLFCLTHTELLVAIAKGEINPKEIALETLRNRGLDINGKWIGFSK